ncbi:MAG: hypothetical protein AAFY11_12275 [Cyanobacteria bacterium J06641_5]
MTGKTFDGGATGALILILPIAMVVAIAYAAWPILSILIGSLFAWWVWQRVQWRRWSREVDPVFNRLVRENQGCLTPLDLSTQANLSATAARRFLEKKALEYGAQRKDFAQQGSVYYFLTTSAMAGLFTQSEPLAELDLLEAAEDEDLGLGMAFGSAASATPTTLEAKVADDGPLPEGALIQAELAKRLQVHASTVYKRRADADFSQWSRGRDPEGKAWRYFAERKVFVPAD